MNVYRDVENYTVRDSVSIVDALAALNVTKNKILFVTNSFGVALAAFSDGDFRRWVVSSRDIDLEKPIIEIANKNFVSAHEDADRTDIGTLFSEKIQIIPLVDDDFRVKAIAVPSNRILSVGKFNISRDSRAFVIAEIGNNHNGSLDEARRLVDSAVAAGADCVKFQMRDLENLYVHGGESGDATADLGTQYVLDLLSRFQLDDGEFDQLFTYCRDLGVEVLCTPFDIASADKLERLGVSAYKVASADLTNHELLTHLAGKRKPLLVSTGMSTEQEIVSAIELLRDHNVRFVMLHCNSTYPCPVEDINLSYMWFT